jgi:hypothetical protein
MHDPSVRTVRKFKRINSQNVNVNEEISGTLLQLNITF